MSPVFKAVVIVAVAAVLCAATFFLVPQLRRSGNDAGVADSPDKDVARELKTDVSASARPKSSAGTHAGQSRSPGEYAANVQEYESDFGEMSEVEEMIRDFEEMLGKFRGTPEERQEVMDECESGRELIRLIADLSESSIEKMSPEELEKERESFEKEYRAQLELLRTGHLQSMLTTPEEQEIIGGTVDEVQDFLERVDSALLSAGY